MPDNKNPIAQIEIALLRITEILMKLYENDQIILELLKRDKSATSK